MVTSRRFVARRSKTVKRIRQPSRRQVGGLNTQPERYNVFNARADDRYYHYNNNAPTHHQQNRLLSVYKTSGLLTLDIPRLHDFIIKEFKLISIQPNVQTIIDLCKAIVDKKYAIKTFQSKIDNPEEFYLNETCILLDSVEEMIKVGQMANIIDYMANVLNHEIATLSTKRDKASQTLLDFMDNPSDENRNNLQVEMEQKNCFGRNINNMDFCRKNYGNIVLERIKVKKFEDYLNNITLSPT